ncbi:hypothetical protein BpHYR1_019784 [Brachionus plicatilis]|uniref:Uncharacterized protein n=1 Tax=Brachionus plicatilis TaxID=10195 RepID=A0A3M7QM57_BRAPC|nr:hypothetical protein BpHYR1_019784 [Brachionus plicatilis]
MVVQFIVAVTGTCQISQHLLSHLTGLIVHLFAAKLSICFLNVTKQLLLLLNILPDLFPHGPDQLVQLGLYYTMLVKALRARQSTDQLGSQRIRIDALHFTLEHFAHISQRLHLVHQPSQVFYDVCVLKCCHWRCRWQRTANLMCRLAQQLNAISVLGILFLNDLVGLDGALYDALVLSYLRVKILGQLG